MQQPQQQTPNTLDRGDLPEQRSSPSLPLPSFDLHAHALRGMNGDTNTIGASFAPPAASSRASPFSAAPGATGNAMAASVFPPQSQPPRLPVTAQSSFPGLSSSIAANPIRPFDRDVATLPVGASSFAPSVATAASSALIRRLPRDTSEGTLKVMMTFSKDLSGIELLPPDQDDRGFRSAILSFNTQAGAHEVKSMLDGKKNTGGASMVVEVLEGGSPTTGPTRRYQNDMSVPVATSTSASSTASSHSNSGRHTSRFNGLFMSDSAAAPMNSYFENPQSAVENGYLSSYNTQSPIGNHRRPAAIDSGKALIKNETAEDDEQLLSDLHPSKDPGGLGALDQPPMPSQRRSTAPHIPVTRFSNLTLTTSMEVGPSSMPPYGSGGSAHFGHSTMSPSAMTAGPHPHGFGTNFRSHPQFPPVNPADQNPPCNTLYVGNLPANTSEEELKAMFSKQRGYKRLCFRTKQNGPMCFVEFEDVSFATKALNELYGCPLHNSVKGGIRLSFSKNPLGVRSGQNPNQAGAGGMGGGMAGMNGMMNGNGANGYAAATGPPPGISGPPGFGNVHRGGFSNLPAAPSPSAAANPYMSAQFNGVSSNVWNGPNAMAAGGPSRGLAGYNAQMYGA